MEKKTKKGTKKLLMSVMVMAIALVGAATSTFAWFTTSAAPRTDEFQVQVSTVSGLYIALDNTAGATSYYNLNYKSYITAAEIYNVINPHPTDATQSGSLRLVPFQANEALDTFTDFEDNAATPEGAADTTANRNYTADDRAYFSFDLYFRGGDDYENAQIALDFRTYGTSATKKTYVAPSATQTVMNPEDIPQSWLNYDISAPGNWNYIGGVLNTIDTARYGVPGTITVANTGAIKSNAANALRLGFTGTSDLTTPATVDTYTWDPRMTSGYHGFTDLATRTGGNAVNNFALDLKNAFNQTEIEIPPAYFDHHLEDDDFATEYIIELSTDRSDKDAGGDGFFYGKINVKIWIDGWDADCLNAIMGDIGRIALQFRTL